MSIVITYNGHASSTAEGGDFVIDGAYTLEWNYASVTVSWRVWVYGSVADLSAAFETRFGSLRVQVEGADVLNVTHDDHTGFNAVGSLRKVGDPDDVIESGLYECSVTVGRPASDNQGLREASVALSYADSRRRRYSFTLHFTALPGTGSAAAVWSGRARAYCQTVIDADGGDFEIVSEDYARDDQNKVMTGTLVYLQVPRSQSAQGWDDPAIVNPQFSLRRTDPWPGDTPGLGVRRLAQVRAEYSTAIDLGVQSDLEAAYQDRIKPFLLQEVRARWNVSGIAVIDQTWYTDEFAHRISGSMTMQVSIGGSTLLEHRVEMSLDVDEGRRFTRRWNSDPYEGRVDQGPKVAIRQTIVTEVTKGDVALPSISVLGHIFSGGSDNSALGVLEDPSTQEIGAPRDWFVTRWKRSHSPVQWGSDEDGLEGIRATATTWVITEQFIREAPDDAGPTTGGR